MIQDQNSKTWSIAPGSGQHVEELVTTFVESLEYYMNPIFTYPLGLPLIDSPSMRYFDAYSSYKLPPGSTITQSFGVNPTSFSFPEGLGSFSFSTSNVANTASISSLPKTSMTQVIPTQPLSHTSPFTHGSALVSSLFPYYHFLNQLRVNIPFTNSVVMD